MLSLMCFKCLFEKGIWVILPYFWWCSMGTKGTCIIRIQRTQIKTDKVWSKNRARNLARDPTLWLCTRIFSWSMQHRCFLSQPDMEVLGSVPPLVSSRPPLFLSCNMMLYWAGKTYWKLWFSISTSDIRTDTVKWKEKWKRILVKQAQLPYW